ncbi:MAG: TIGR02117 family protein [Sphingomonadaceae bacterium]
MAWQRRWRRAVALSVLAPLGGYLAAAGIGSHWMRNADWRPPAEGVRIFVASNGVHTGILVPVAAAGVDWRGRVTVTPETRWLLIGWGDRRFYLETPTWRDVRPGTALAALVGSGRTVLHVDRWRDFMPDDSIRPLTLRPAEYRRLAAFIDAHFAAMPETLGGYGTHDSFHAARGRYHALYTCNVWTADALRAAGVRAPRWSPIADGVMRATRF